MRNVNYPRTVIRPKNIMQIQWEVLLIHWRIFLDYTATVRDISQCRYTATSPPLLLLTFPSLRAPLLVIRVLVVSGSVSDTSLSPALPRLQHICHSMFLNLFPIKQYMRKLIPELSVNKAFVVTLKYRNLIISSCVSLTNAREENTIRMIRSGSSQRIKTVTTTTSMSVMFSRCLVVLVMSLCFLRTSWRALTSSRLKWWGLRADRWYGIWNT